MSLAQREPRGAGMEAIKLFLSLCVFGAMVLLCLLRLDWAGVTGLAFGLIGFVSWAYTGAPTSMGERLGNGYVGAFIGLCLGFALGGAAQFIWAQLHAS